MSSEKIERILSTYKPVKDYPGYVWINNDSIVKLETLREAYKEYFNETGSSNLSENNSNN